MSVLGLAAAATPPRGRHLILSQRLGSGLHRILVRVDGGEWRPPDNLPRAEDEFGAKVGLVVVP